MPASFPSPLRVRAELIGRTRGAILFALLVALPLGGYVGWTALRTALELHEQGEIWHHGSEGAVKKVTGDQSSRAILYSLDLVVHFVDADGAKHSAAVNASSALESFDTSGPAVLRFDPAHPQRVALSYVQGLSYGGWLWIALAFALSAVFLFGGLVIPPLANRELRAARLCAADAELWVIELESVDDQLIEGRPTGSYEISYRLPGETQLRNALCHRQPLTKPTATGQFKGLVLRSRLSPDSPVVLCEGLYPYETSTPELALARAVLETAVLARSA